MNVLYEVLRYADVAAFLGLVAITFNQWRARRDEPSLWAVLTFATLAIATLLGVVLPENPSGSVAESIQTVQIGILLLFPYFLFRVASSFSPGRFVWVDRAAAVITAGLVLWAVVLPRFPAEGEPRSLPFQTFIAVVLVQWVGLSLFVAIRFWQAGADQAVVARRRMRTLSIAATTMSMAIVIAGTGRGEQSIEIDILVQLIVLASVIAFFVAFSPPAWLRAVWRREAQTEVRRAATGVLSASSAEEVIETVLPRAAAVVGGRGIAMFDTNGRLLGAFGFGDEEAVALDGVLAGDSPENVRLDYPFGSLIVRTTRHTPFFGEDDIDLLGAIGVVTNLALQRLEAADVERQLAEARLRRRQALEINDNIVQRLAVAHYAFELGDVEEARKALDAALAAARRTISDLLGELAGDDGIDNSTLTRDQPASER